MKLYKLPIVLYEPSEETNDMFLAEVPVLPGCRAWGETPSEAFIESYMEHGNPLPEELETLALKPVGQVVHAEVTVAA